MSNPVFLVMPQWQGSPSSRAMQLADGAQLLREDLPSASTREIPVPLEAGDAMGTPVARLSSLLRARDAAREALEAITGPAIVVGGDGASTLAALEAAASSDPGRALAVVWLSAQPDLQHPSTSPNGAASGMALRLAIGGVDPDLDSRHPIDGSQVALVGVRMADPDEAEAVLELGAARLAHEDDDSAERLAVRVRDHLRETGAERVYLHVDLDVLDPSEFAAVHAPVPFGLTVQQLTETIRAAVGELALAGATICEFAPGNAEQAADGLPVVLRILAALTSGNQR